ncbi:hypothetical protein [Bifidobacterium crudilactis]|uniref:hypothetical protein n=1 Tax=Bifidobacterium crudilactis TaxID=327277 RepID=UPI002356EA87|nr:hypothetical protein [Bifidobacterium crudilactis]MCI1217130.1 hypothetical protein [Bifidobacterium crudilactis]
MISKTAEETIKELHNELNEAKKNLDQFGRLTRGIEQRASEAHRLLERLKSNPNLSESQIFESVNMPKTVQRLIKSIPKNTRGNTPGPAAPTAHDQTAVNDSRQASGTEPTNI